MSLRAPSFSTKDSVSYKQLKSHQIVNFLRVKDMLMLYLSQKAKKRHKGISLLCL